MKVKYIKKSSEDYLIDNVNYNIGNVYDVFGIVFDFYHQEVLVHIRSDYDGTPSLLNLKFFELIEPKIPENWQLRVNSNGSHVFLEPCEFKEDFWDRYHEGDEEAEAILESVYNRLCSHN